MAEFVNRRRTGSMPSASVICASGPSEPRMIRHAYVRTRKFDQNGMRTSTMSTLRHFAERVAM